MPFIFGFFLISCPIWYPCFSSSFPYNSMPCSGMKWTLFKKNKIKRSYHGSPFWNCFLLNVVFDFKLMNLFSQFLWTFKLFIINCLIKAWSHSQLIERLLVNWLFSDTYDATCQTFIDYHEIAIILHEGSQPVETLFPVKRGCNNWILESKCKITISPFGCNFELFHFTNIDQKNKINHFR